MIFFQSSWRAKSCSACLLSLFAFSLFIVTDALALDKNQTPLSNELTRVSTSLGPKIAVGISVVELDSGEEFFARNANTLLTPASTMKIPLSYAVLKMLGGSYRFPTEFFVRKNEDGSKTLYVRGYGDPSVVNETLWSIAQRLNAFGVKEVRQIALDDSLFIDPDLPTGNRSYEAGQSALTVNHNSYAVIVAPASLGDNAYVSVTPGSGTSVSADVRTVQGGVKDIRVTQVPGSANASSDIYSFHQQQVSGKPFVNLSVKVTGQIGIKSEPLTHYYSVPYPTLYFGNLLSYFLTQNGTSVAGDIVRAEVPQDAEKVLLHKSKPLSFILRDLNQYSNNVIANHLLFALGQDEHGVFRREVAFQRVKAQMAGLGIPADSFEIYDGSGLDARNKLSASQLTTILLALERDFSVYPDFLASLSQYSHSGTLKEREIKGLSEASQSLVWGKTGTLTGVSSLAGYIQGRSGKRYAYSIIINGRVPKSKATDYEDTILKTILVQG